MREIPATALCAMVDDWWNAAQWRSPHSPEALQLKAERDAGRAAAQRTRKRPKSYEQKLRDRLKARAK